MTVICWHLKGLSGLLLEEESEESMNAEVVCKEEMDAEVVCKRLCSEYIDCTNREYMECACSMRYVIMSSVNFLWLFASFLKSLSES